MTTWDCSLWYATFILGIVNSNTIGHHFTLLCNQSRVIFKRVQAHVLLQSRVIFRRVQALVTVACNFQMNASTYYRRV